MFAFGFNKFDTVDVFDFGTGSDPLADIEIDLSLDPVFTGDFGTSVPDTFASDTSGGSLVLDDAVVLGFSGGFSGSGSLSGSLSAGVGDDGSTFADLSFDFFGF